MDTHMEIKDIKYIIINLLKNIIRVFKEIRTLPNVWLYILLSIFFTFIFLIFTFPYNALIRNQLETIGENIGRSVYIGKIDFSLLNSTEIDNMTIILNDGSEIALQNLNLDIGFFSALISNSVNGTLHVNNIKYGKEKTSINVVARSDFKLEFNSFSEFPVNGRIKLDLQNIIASGITIKGFDIPPVRFSAIAADLNILKKKLTLADCKLSGPDLKGSITGYLTIAKPFQQSQLSLKVAIDSSSSFLENYKILLSKWIDSTNKIQIIIRGSISNPKIDSPEQKNNTNPRIEPIEQRNIKKPGINSLPRTRMEPSLKLGIDPFKQENETGE